MSFKIHKHGYCYIPLPSFDEIIKRKRKLISHGKQLQGHFTGKITCELTTVTPVHIGSGLFELAEDAGFDPKFGIVKGIVKDNETGEPIIPGSSLKGAFRSILEAISYSCFLAKKFGYSTCTVKNYDDKVCTACHIFGAMGYQGRISFEAAKIRKDKNGKDHNIKTTEPFNIIQHYGPKNPKPKRRFYPHIDYQSDEFWQSILKDQLDITAEKNKSGQIIRRMDKNQFFKKKVKEPFDFIAPRTKMKFSIKLENMESSEIGLLITALGIGENNQTIFCPSIGGSKPFCFGTIEIKIESIYKTKFSDDLIHGFEEQTDSFVQIANVNDWINQHLQSLFNAADDEQLIFPKGFDL
ncbi:MAG: RAMP superfamily CRISPR-associated protein, partial [Promethearchaeota archaeon]